MQDTILGHAYNWLQLQTWKNAVSLSEEHEYVESFDLIELIKDYCSNLESSYGSLYNIPVFGQFIETIENQYNIEIFSDRPDFY
ncbi:hypothetical protein [Paenibacillus wynnii]|uniref:hypothetical protein n=1 Tax=Paenibacillus wynnii TaxID=268407 RepID=UPI0027D825AF|nr:hypothetical protein [Paenibacillus wynnii]